MCNAFVAACLTGSELGSGDGGGIYLSVAGDSNSGGGTGRVSALPTISFIDVFLSNNSAGTPFQLVLKSSTRLRFASPGVIPVVLRRLVCSFQWRRLIPGSWNGDYFNARLQSSFSRTGGCSEPGRCEGAAVRFDPTSCAQHIACVVVY